MARINKYGVYVSGNEIRVKFSDANNVVVYELRKSVNTNV